MNEKEIWKPVKENCSYSVSSLGRVKNNKTNHILKQSRPTSRKYKVVYIYIKEKHRSKQKFIHALVMHAFVGYPTKGQQIDHINGDKFDNRLCNLEYVTQDENIKRAMNNNLSPTYKGKQFIPLNILPNDIKIYKYCLHKHRLVNVYNSIDEMCNDLYNFGLTSNNDYRLRCRIRRILLSNKSTAFGLRWECPQAIECKNKYIRSLSI